MHLVIVLEKKSEKLCMLVRLGTSHQKMLVLVGYKIAVTKLILYLPTFPPAFPWCDFIFVWFSLV